MFILYLKKSTNICVRTRTYILFNYLMITYSIPVSFTISRDSVANSVSLRDADSVGNILDIFLKQTEAIQHIIGVPLETLTTIQE